MYEDLIGFVKISKLMVVSLERLGREEEGCRRPLLRSGVNAPAKLEMSTAGNRDKSAKLPLSVF